MALREHDQIATHEVTNQPPPLAGYDVFSSDRALVEGVEREGAAWALDDLRTLGRWAGAAETISLGQRANRYPPELHTHDRFGHRIDEVTFDPAWHELMANAVAHGVHTGPWSDPRQGAHVARAAKMILISQVEAGHGCPISMTYSAVPALRVAPEVAAHWEAPLLSRSYDPAFRPVSEKAGALCGMAMTEKQGGSDVRANTTRAEPAADGYRITGHKWFCSAPMCDVFLVLAQAPGGLTCFLLPRWTPDGERNAIHIQRLKDKLGNRSNASSEVEFVGAWAHRIGEEGRGVRTIIEMVNHTRLDCVLGSTAGMRLGVAHATHHATHRWAFGKPLVEQPLMLNVLADLAVEAEAATTLALRLARAYDADDPRERAFRRLATAVGKYWVCKRAPAHAAETLECHGGNGYVEESVMPRMYRESPLNGIWEGSGNVMCLDVLRAMAREPESLDAFLDEIESVRGTEPAVDRAVDAVKTELSDLEDIETRARRVVERMAVALQGALLVRDGNGHVASAYCASRLSAEQGRAFGTLPPSADLSPIVERARPI